MDNQNKLFDRQSILINNRRQFLAALLAYCGFSKLLTAYAVNGLETAYFIFADLKQGVIYLPDKQTIVSGQPGSIMKLIAATALLEENLSSGLQIYDCRGTIIVNGERYACRYPHGRISLVEAIGQSCNVFFAHCSYQISKQCFGHYLQKFGLSISPASLHRKIIDGHGPSTNLILGIADGFTLNALQILQLAATIAMRGNVPLMHFADDSESKVITVNPNLKEHSWNILQSGMQIARERGTAKNLDPQNQLHLATKTGTSLHGKKFQSWLTGYFPCDSPHYAFCLRANVGTSYDQAVPLARKYLFSRKWV